MDTQYKMGLLSSLDKAYQVRRLFIRDEARDFSLTKELRDLDFDGLGERETLIKVHDYFIASTHRLYCEGHTESLVFVSPVK